METETTNAVDQSALSATSPEPPVLEPTDDELREQLAKARRRVTIVYDLEKQPMKEPVALESFTPRIPRADGEITVLPPSGKWEPQCVICGAPLGYTAREGCYVAGRTECASCRAGSLSVRLKASGISFRELDQPLSSLVRPIDDPECRGLDTKAIRDRTAEFDRYLTFLSHFAALRPDERIDPPFAFVYGNLGTGKSAGTERALRDAITNGCAGRVVRFSDLLRKIYDTYRRAESSDRDNDRRDYSTEDVIRTYSSIHLLVIHEVGPDAESDHALGLFFDFVDARFSAKLPTIFDSNYAPDAESLGNRMGGRASDDVRVRGIIDRISGGITDGKQENVFCLLGPSWRGRGAA